MKKLIAQLLVVLVLASSVALVAGCAKQEESAEPPGETSTPQPE